MIVLLLNIAFRADTKDRLDEFMTWGEEIILRSTDLFLVSCLIATCVEVTDQALP